MLADEASTGAQIKAAREAHKAAQKEHNAAKRAATKKEKESPYPKTDAEGNVVVPGEDASEEEKKKYAEYQRSRGALKSASESGDVRVTFGENETYMMPGSDLPEIVKQPERAAMTVTQSTEPEEPVRGEPGAEPDPVLTNLSRERAKREAEGGASRPGVRQSNFKRASAVSGQGEDSAALNLDTGGYLPSDSPMAPGKDDTEKETFQREGQQEGAALLRGPVRGAAADSSA